MRQLFLANGSFCGNSIPLEPTVPNKIHVVHMSRASQIVRKSLHVQIIVAILAIQPCSVSACDRCNGLNLIGQPSAIYAYQSPVSFQPQYSYAAAVPYAAPVAYQPSQTIAFGQPSFAPAYSPFVPYAQPLYAPAYQGASAPSNNLLTLGLGLGLPLAKEALCRAAGCSNSSSGTDEQVSELVDEIRSLKKEFKALKKQIEDKGDDNASVPSSREVQLAQLKHLLQTTSGLPITKVAKKSSDQER